MALNWQVYEGRVSSLRTAKSSIGAGKSHYDAVWFSCVLDDAIAESVFTTIQFKDGDLIRVVYSTNWLGDRHTIQAVLNLNNGMLHVNPWLVTSSKLEFFLQSIQATVLIFLLIFAFFSFLLILPMFYAGEAVDKVISIWSGMLSLTLLFSPIAIVAVFFTFLSMLGSVKELAEILRLLRFPEYRNISLYKIVAFKDGLPRLFYKPAMYKEGGKVFYGIYDCHIIFKDQPDYLRDVILKPEKEH